MLESAAAFFNKMNDVSIVFIGDLVSEEPDLSFRDLPEVTYQLSGIIVADTCEADPVRDVLNAEFKHCMIAYLNRTINELVIVCRAEFVGAGLLKSG